MLGTAMLNQGKEKKAKKNVKRRWKYVYFLCREFLGKAAGGPSPAPGVISL